MPVSGRDFDARLERISVSTRSVSPWRTGAGNATSSNPRFPNVVPSVVSATERPTTRPRVNTEFTIRVPNSVPAEKCSSRWSGWGFIVMELNSTLSVSVTVLVASCAITLPTSNSSKCIPAMTGVLLTQLRFWSIVCASSTTARAVATCAAST